MNRGSEECRTNRCKHAMWLPSRAIPWRDLHVIDIDQALANIRLSSRRSRVIDDHQSLRHIAKDNPERLLFPTTANPSHFRSPIPMGTFLPMPVIRPTLQQRQSRLPDFFDVELSDALECLQRVLLLAVLRKRRPSNRLSLMTLACPSFGVRSDKCQSKMSIRGKCHSPWFEALTAAKTWTREGRCSGRISVVSRFAFGRWRVTSNRRRRGRR